MKKITVFMLTAFLLLSLAGCQSSEVPDETEAAETTAEETTAPVTECPHSYEESVETAPKALTDGVKKFTCTACGDAYTEAIPATKTMKILAIGNSFSVDAMQYLWNIAKEGGVEKITLGNLYIGSSTLDKHAANIEGAAAAYTYYKNTEGTWVTTKSVSIQSALAEEEWDIVTVQQGSGSSGIASTYSKLNDILAFLEKTEPNADVYWHMTWAYQQDSTHKEFPKYSSDQMTMYNAILDAAKTEVKTKDSILGVVPVGTAIQNLRTSYIGDTVTRDGYHMSHDFGRYTAALTWFVYFTGASADTISWLPPLYTAKLQPHLPAIREAVAGAIASPDTVTTVKAAAPAA